MRGLLRGSVVLAASLAIGSWLGLGRPEVRRAWTMPAPTIPQKTAPAPSEPPIRDDPTLPQARDPSLVPSFGAWPRTNPEASIAKAWMLAEGPARAPGDNRRLVTFTFDDGPSPDVTPGVLRLLARYHVHATFFVIGRYLDGDSPRAQRRREILKRIERGGHLVGNHTHDHSNLTLMPPADAQAQIERGSASIERALGRRPILFRPPYGLLDDTGEKLVRDRSLELVLWSVEARDMERDDPKEMFKELVIQLETKGGGIVLLHDMKPTSVDVLSRLLEYMRHRPWDPSRPERAGYEIVDLPEYLRAVAASPPHPSDHGHAAIVTPAEG